MIVKNEERHIAEWLAWQFLIGFDTVVLLDNGSTDRTKEIAASFQPRYDVRVIDWPDRAQGTQQRAYMHALALLQDEFEWLAFFDADEFLVLDEGLSLPALLAQRPEAAIGVPWAMFGSSGHKDYPKGLMIEAFTHRAPDAFGPNAHIKSILRPKLAKRAFNPHAFEVGEDYVDFRGKKLTFSTPGVIAGSREYGGARLHHYFTKSWAHWQERLKRGNLGGLRTEQQFFDYDRNEVPDISAARHAPRIRSMIEALQQPQDGEVAAGMAAPQAARGKIAVVLVVKNEKDDILSWLAWYRLLGFDAAIVYDDDSTDGTWEILTAAAARWDIRLSRTVGPRGVAYERRQEDSYRYALAAYKEVFEWLAFFDADEFLQLCVDESVAAFLSRLPEADEVAVNWCNYGSSGQVLKPELPGPLVYRWHGTAQRPINRHVKCFVRPRAVGERWINVHCFDVAPERAFLANGRPVSWSETRGITADEPDWSIAKLMHYQCRSMEHLVERVKKHPRLQNVPKLWQAYDVHDEEDVRPLARAEALQAGIAALTAPGAPLPGPAAGDVHTRLRLGIAITTLNRREMVLELVARLRQLTRTPFELVICDDGSEDGTVQALRERGETVIAGPNRGGAWNKNRGIYYLTVVRPVDVVVLLDDDVLPQSEGWEAEWIEAAERYGHVSHAHPIYYSQIVGGELTAASPGLLPATGGSAMAFNRLVLAQLGYMDPRFGRYGHEHTELTLRAIRAGYGGVVLEEGGERKTLFFAIKGEVEALPVLGVGNAEDIETNGKVMAMTGAEPVYRQAWCDDEQMRLFLAEQAGAVQQEVRHLFSNENHFASLEAYERVRRMRAAKEGRNALDETAPEGPPLIFLIGNTDPAVIDDALTRDEKIVAVQPDAQVYYALTDRFAAPIADGRLVLENFAPAPRGGEIALLQPADGARPYPVATISWAELVAKYGRPTRVQMAVEIPGYPVLA